MIEVEGHAGVVGAEGGLPDAQGALVQGQSFALAAETRTCPAHVAEVYGHVGVVAAESRFPDAEGSLLQRQGLGGSAQGSQCVA